MKGSKVGTSRPCSTAEQTPGKKRCGKILMIIKM